MSAIARASATRSPSSSTARNWTRARRPAEALPGRARQQGAIGLFGILTLLLALLFTALAVDTGRLWFEHRQLQAVADIAALEAARSLDCGRNPGNAAAIAQAAAKRNGFTGDLGVSPNRVEVGGLNTVNGLRKFQSGGDRNVVHVLATNPVPASLVLGGFFGKTTLISAQATARGEPPHATFSAGSYLLRIGATNQDANLLNGLLGGLLGSSLSLDALSYKGLASADVNLAQLVRASGTVGSVEGLLNANLSVAQVIDLTAGALQQQGAAQVALDALQQIRAAAEVNQAMVRLGDVLDVKVPASDAAGKVGVNVFDLVNTTIMVANHQHAVSLPLAIQAGQLLQVNSRIDIISPPQIAVGPPGQDAAGQWCAQARTAQVRVTATTRSDITVLGTGIVLDLGLSSTVAPGEAHLATLAARAGATQAVIGATPGIATVNLTGSSGTGTATATAMVLGIPVPIRIGLNLPIQTASAASLTYNVATPIAGHLPATQSIASPVGGSLANALSNPNAITLEPDLSVLGVLGLLLQPVAKGIINGLLGPLVNTVLSPLLSSIGTQLLDPLLKLLGIQLGGLDVTVEDIEYTGGSQLVI